LQKLRKFAEVVQIDAQKLVDSLALLKHADHAAEGVSLLSEEKEDQKV